MEGVEARLVVEKLARGVDSEEEGTAWCGTFTRCLDPEEVVSCFLWWERVSGMWRAVMEEDGEDGVAGALGLLVEWRRR